MPLARAFHQSSQMPPKTAAFASPQASGVPPKRGAKYSPSSRRHSGARRSLSLSTPPSSRKTTRIALTGALAARDVARQPRPAAAHRGGDALGVEPEVPAPDLLRAVVHPLVGYAEDLELDLRAPLGEELADRRAEAARDDVLLHGEHAADPR